MCFRRNTFESVAKIVADGLESGELTLSPVTSLGSVDELEYTPSSIEGDFAVIRKFTAGMDSDNCGDLLHWASVTCKKLLQGRTIEAAPMRELNGSGMSLLVMETRRVVPHRIYYPADVEDIWLKRVFICHEIIHLLFDGERLASGNMSESLMERQRANALGSILAARRGHVKARWKADPKMVGELAGIIGERGLPGDIVGAVVKFLLDTDDN